MALGGFLRQYAALSIKKIREGASLEDAECRTLYAWCEHHECWESFTVCLDIGDGCSMGRVVLLEPRTPCVD